MSTIESTADAAAPKALTDHRRLLRRRRVVMVCLILMVPLSAWVALAIGPVSVSLGETGLIFLKRLGVVPSVSVDALNDAVIWTIRLPRVLLGLLVGATLALAGASLQGLFRNPLADPGLIGISSGAALAAASVIVFGTKVTPLLPGMVAPFLLPLAAFGGGLATTWIIYRISLHEGRTVVATMLLAGIAVNALAGSATGLFSYLATDDQLRTLTFWSLGSLGGATWATVGTAAIFLVPAAWFLLREARVLNALLLGESEAQHLGFDAQKAKRRIVLWAALAVGAGVAFCGVIGFVGLVVPHVVRLLLGPDHRRLMPASICLGAALLLLADLVARTIVAPAELPIGILTALLGAPFFLWLLLRQRAAWG